MMRDRILENAAKKARAKSKKLGKKKKNEKILDHPINFVVGSLGSGKSYYAQRYVFKYMKAGKLVAANFDLVGDWWHTTARDGFKRRYGLEPEERYQLAKDVRSKVYRFDVIDELYEFRPPGEGEDRGLLVLDEGALQMNTREYTSRAKADKEKYENPLRSLEFYINMRKRGWSSLILAHHHDQLDNQLRHMGGQIIRLRNLARIKMPFIGIKMARNDRFVAVHIDPSTKPALRTKVEVYGLDLNIAKHYKSQQEFEHEPESRGLRLQAPYQAMAKHPSQPVYTFERIRERLAATEGAHDRTTDFRREEGGASDGASTGPFPGGWNTESVGGRRGR
jgi:hypothetical protein